jgi:copper chaperone CopZ
MNIRLSTLVVVALVGAAVPNALACPVDSSSAPHHVAAGGGKMKHKAACYRDVKFEVMGMECADCANKVSTSLKALKGVEAVNIDLDNGVASVNYCSMEIKDTHVLIEAIKKAGYEAKLAAAEPKTATP